MEQEVSSVATSYGASLPLLSKASSVLPQIIAPRPLPPLQRPSVSPASGSVAMAPRAAAAAGERKPEGHSASASCTTTCRFTSATAATSACSRSSVGSWRSVAPQTTPPQGRREHRRRRRRVVYGGKHVSGLETAEDKERLQRVLGVPVVSPLCGGGDGEQLDEGAARRFFRWPFHEQDDDDDDDDEELVEAEEEERGE